MPTVGFEIVTYQGVFIAKNVPYFLKRIGSATFIWVIHGEQTVTAATDVTRICLLQKGTGQGGAFPKSFGNDFELYSKIRFGIR